MAEGQEITKLDLCFVCDTTGSMRGSIIAVQTHLKNIAEALTASEKRDLRLACVEYKDHCDQIVTSSEDFTPSVSKVKQYIDKWTATGGGDHPEAIAEGLLVANKLSWRSDATKMLVLCADAPPHGVGASGDSYPHGSPLGNDPLLIARHLVRKEVIMYTVGVNHPDRHTVSFLCTLSRMSGGRYLPLAEASNLPTILLGGAEEEVELAKFEKMMDEEEELVLKQAKEKGEVLGEEEVSKRVAANLAKKEVKVTQLQVSRCGGGEFWQKQEDFLVAQPNLSAYKDAQSKVDYSDIPSHSGGASSCTFGPQTAPPYDACSSGAPMINAKCPRRGRAPYDAFSSGSPMAAPMRGTRAPYDAFSSGSPMAAPYDAFSSGSPMAAPYDAFSSGSPMAAPYDAFSSGAPMVAPIGFSTPSPAPMMQQQMPMQSMGPIESNSGGNPPQGQCVQQVSDYIQPEQVMRYMNRKKS